MTLVSVLMAAHNGAEYLAEAIDSVYAQTTPDWELIVVDDVSTDETPAIVEGYARSDNRVRLIRRTEQGGPYIAANEGLASVRGRYIARLDSDDVCLPERFAKQLAFLEAHTNLRACTSNITVLSASGTAPFRVRDIPSLPGSIKWGLAVRGFLHSTVMVSTDAMREIGGYRPLPVSQDHRLWCDLSRRGWLGAIDEPLVLWRVHAAQISETRLDMQRRLGAEAIVDHFHELGLDWSYDDVFRLRSIGQRPVPLRAGLRQIARFRAAWSSDGSLTRGERGELEALTKRLRYELVRDDALAVPGVRKLYRRMKRS